MVNIKKLGNKYFYLKFCSLIIITIIFLTGTNCIEQLDFELEEILVSAACVLGLLPDYFPYFILVNIY